MVFPRSCFSLSFSLSFSWSDTGPDAFSFFPYFGAFTNFSVPGPATPVYLRARGTRQRDRDETEFAISHDNG